MQHDASVVDAPPVPSRGVPLMRRFNLTFHGLGAPGSTILEMERRYWLAEVAFDRILDRAMLWSDACITFDDGNLSDFTVALPQLLKRQLHGNFFVLAGRLNSPGYLGSHELRQLLAAGMEIGSHGMHHRSWRRLPEGDLRQEIVDAKARLEDLLGIPITQAACPFGEYGRAALRMLADAGFQRVYTSDRGWAKSSAWLQPRNTVTATTAIEDLEAVRAWPGPKQWLHHVKLSVKRRR